MHNPDSPLLIDDVVNEVRKPIYIENEQPVGERILTDRGVEI